MTHVRALAVLAVLALSAPVLAAPDLPRTNFEIRTLSNRADLISGGDALVEVTVPNTVPLHQVRLLLNGADVTATFVTNASTRTMRNDPNFTTPVYDMAVCDADFPQADGLGRMAKRASPRQVAGGPLAENILKCELKPLDAADYAPRSFDATQWARLSAIFPNGVCDWTRPGIGQQPAISPLTFTAGPGGSPLPPAPVSEAAPER